MDKGLLSIETKFVTTITKSKTNSSTHDIRYWNQST